MKDADSPPTRNMPKKNTHMEPSESRQHLKEIFEAGLNRVDPFQMITDHVRLNGTTLEIKFENTHKKTDLADFRQIYILGAGKATAPMARAFETILGDKIKKGVIAVKYGHTAPLEKISIMEAGHPQPDENGVRATLRLMELAAEADASTLVITLISGGGSALLPLPMHCEIAGNPVRLTLADKQAVTRELLICGADITEINCIRKHLSGIKGGRLLEQIAPATSLNFILSDVVGDDLSSIASGCTTYDPTTYDHALAVLEKYGIADTVPPKVLQTLQLGSSGSIPETLKQGHQALDLSTNFLIGTNRLAMSAAGEKARSLGYNLTFLTSHVTGEAKEVAKLLAGVAADIASEEMLTRKPACVISGGEPVVTLQGKGKGGRNQEMALAFLAEMERNPDLFQNVSFLAASTDGNDGPTDAAGAYASPEMLRRAAEAGLSISDYLQNNDSYHFFDAIRGLCKTGPTNTNVCDLHILVVT